MQRIPNILSVSRIVLAPLFVVMYIQDALLWSSLSIAVFAIAAVTDYFDGYIARHYAAGSKAGVFLDPLADKILTFAGFICLPFISSEQFPWWAIILIFLRDIFVTLLRIWASRRGKEMQTSISAKAKTFSQMVFLYIVLLVGVFVQAEVTIGEYSRQLLNTGILEWVFYAVTFITVYTGVEYTWVNRHLFTKQI